MTPRRLELDYLVAPRRTAWPGMLLLVVALAVAAELFVRYRDARLELARFEAAAGLAAPERRSLAAGPKERLDEEVKSAEAVVRQLTLPWDAVIHTIEHAAMREVAILQLEPNAETRVVRLTAQARSREAMFAYLRRLGAAKEVSEVHLVSHQVQREDPQRPLQFSVHAALKAAR